MTRKRTQGRMHARVCMQGGAHTRVTCSRVGRLALMVLVLVMLGTGCEPVNTKLETDKIAAQADLAAAEGRADAERVQAEGEAEAAVIAAEAQAMEAEAAANEAKAASTEALAVLQQAQGDRSVKEAVAAQVNSVTETLKAATGTLQTLAVAVVALVVLFGAGVLGFLYLAWRAQRQAAQVPGPSHRYVLVELPEHQAIGRDKVPALLRPIKREVQHER